MWTAILGIFAAVIGFLGVIVGAVVTGYVTLRQTQLATRREREAQQMLREQERRDRRDAFQRDTLLALQDALAEIYRCVARDQDEKLITRRGAPWPDRSIDVPLPHDYMAAYGSSAGCGHKCSMISFAAWPPNSGIRRPWRSSLRTSRPCGGIRDISTNSPRDSTIG